MSTFFITTSRKLTILFLTELILRYENITFFGLFKRSVLRLLFAMPKLVGRSGVMVVQLSSVRGMYFSYCQNLKCRLTLAGCITSSIMGRPYGWDWWHLKFISSCAPWRQEKILRFISIT